MEKLFPTDKTCIVGIGETEYTRWGRIKRSENQLACEAILKAIDDAGLEVEDIDGICSFSNDRNDASWLASNLGMAQLRFSSMVWGGGGGGGSGAVLHALLAVATGTAKYVVAFRALAQGQFGRFGQSTAAGRVGGAAAFEAPYGRLSPAMGHGATARRHMYEYGTQSKHFSMVSVACYKHAQRNPRAVMYGRPLTLEQAESARMICDPLRLYHCTQETDGAAAVVITLAERAKGLKQRPVYIMGAAQGSGFRWGAGGAPFGVYGPAPDFASANYRTVAPDLWARAGITPKDIDVAQMYEHFAPFVLISLEDHGVCKRGEGGAFVEGGRLEWPDGALPCNTSGSNIAEAYTHGFELVNEAVRQMRGTSTCQVKDAEIGLVASGPGVTPVSDMIVRR